MVSSEVIFPTTVYPFQRVTHHTGGEIRLASGRDGGADTDDIIQLIDSKTSVVAVSHVEYRTGQCFDLPALAEAAHSHGALLVVDATQSAGAIPIDAPGEDIDALVSGGYKWLCGPFGAAVMYVGPRLRALEPGLVGWRSHKEMWDLQASRLTYPDGARRFEYSTVAYGCVLGLAQAIDFLVRVDVETIFAHNKKLTNLLIEGLQSRDIKITSPISDSSPPHNHSTFSGWGFGGDRAQAQTGQSLRVGARRHYSIFPPSLQLKRGYRAGSGAH